MSDGRSGDPDALKAPGADGEPALDLGSAHPDEEPAIRPVTPWIRQLTESGMPLAAVALVFGVIGLVVAAFSAAQPACIYPDVLLQPEGLPRWALVSYGLAAAGGALGAATTWAGRRADASLQVSVSLAALVLAGATAAVTLGDVVTRPVFDRELFNTSQETDPFTGLPLDACR
jgi:hypothetical protein